MVFARRPKKNRRIVRQHVLDVRLRTQETRAVRVRQVALSLGLAVGTVAVLYGLWRGGQWTLDRLFLKNPAFAIRRLEIDTANLLPPELVRAWSGIHRGQNLIDLDLERVKRDLQLVPVIASVKLERVPPHTLRIRVRPRLPLVEIQLPELRPEGGIGLASFYVDAEGSVVRFPASDDSLLRRYLIRSDLPRLTGLPVAHVVAGRKLGAANVRAALALADAFGDSPMFGLTELVSIDLSRPDALVVRTSQGNQITFGLRDAPRQLERWRRVHDYATSRGQVIATLDLSVSNNVPAVFERRAATQRTALPTGAASTEGRSDA